MVVSSDPVAEPNASAAVFSAADCALLLAVVAKFSAAVCAALALAKAAKKVSTDDDCSFSKSSLEVKSPVFVTCTSPLITKTPLLQDNPLPPLPLK